MSDIASREHQTAAQTARELLAAYRENEDLISIGAYRRGGNRVVDAAVDMLAELNAFFRQRVDEVSSLETTRDALVALAKRAAARLQAQPAAVAGAGRSPARWRP